MKSEYIEQQNRLTRRYNDAIRSLENSFDMENSQQGWNLSDAYLTEQYSKRYDHLVCEYHMKRRQLLEEYQHANPEWAKWRHFWTKAFFIGIFLLMGSCVYHLPADDTQAATPASSLTDSSVADGSVAETYWNVENIPIPFLQDSTQYVSNPDRVLAQTTVDRMNGTLKRIDNELGVETVVIIVNHIEGDDPFRMAQDIGNRYGVGRGNRGLVIVVGYEDHSINISPGRALEADLTDAECHRLQQQYVVPAMRAEQPDSAMFYLTKAIYATLQKKDLPVMSRLTNADDELDDELAAIIGLHLLLLIGWCAFFLHLNRKYHWLTTIGAVTLLSNPFFVETTRSSGFGGGGFGGGFGGGGGSFSGGSFGGGSFGGGGATSRW